MSALHAEPARGDPGAGKVAGQFEAVRRRPALALFLLFTVLLTAAAYVPLLTLDPGVSARRNYILLLMWAPGVAALLACWMTGIGFAALGWRWPRARWLTWGYLLPVGYAGLAYGVVWIFGFAPFAPTEAIAGLSAAFGWSAPPLVLISVTALIKASAGFVTAASSALGEEIGWRGFLAPVLACRFGAARASLIVGAIWLLWHVPLLVAGGYNNGTEVWFGLSCFTVLVFAGSVVGMWLRVRSGSLWPCVFWHASHNLFIQSVYGSLEGESEFAPYLLGEFGIAVPLALTIVAIPLYRSLAKDDAAVSRRLAERA